MVAIAPRSILPNFCGLRNVDFLFSQFLFDVELQVDIV